MNRERILDVFVAQTAHDPRPTLRSTWAVFADLTRVTVEGLDPTLATDMLQFEVSVGLPPSNGVELLLMRHLAVEDDEGDFNTLSFRVSLLYNSRHPADLPSHTIWGAGASSHDSGRGNPNEFIRRVEASATFLRYLDEEPIRVTPYLADQGD